MDWNAVLPAVLGAVAGGVATYVAIRVDIAVLKTQVLHLEFRTAQNYDMNMDAHDRINRLRHNAPDTR